MSVAIWIIATLLVLGALTYHRCSLRVFTLATVVMLGIATGLQLFGITALTVLWIIAAVILLPLNVGFVRKALLTKPILRIFRKIMPEMSQTEKDAIDAGTVWWDGEIFRGAPNWKNLHNIPAPRLSVEEQAFLRSEERRVG